MLSHNFLFFVLRLGLAGRISCPFGVMIPVDWDRRVCKTCVRRGRSNRVSSQMASTHHILLFYDTIWSLAVVIVCRMWCAIVVQDIFTYTWVVVVADCRTDTDKKCQPGFPGLARVPDDGVGCFFVFSHWRCGRSYLGRRASLESKLGADGTQNCTVG